MAFAYLDTDNLLADEPLTSPEVLALYENPIAIAEGAPGAPRLSGFAAVPNPNLAELAILSVSESSDWISPDVNIIGPLSGVFRVVTLSGTLRFSATHQTLASGGTLEIRRNGVALQSWSIAGAGTETRVLDAASVPADEWEFVVDGGGLTDRRVGATNSYARIGIPIRVSDL